MDRPRAVLKNSASSGRHRPPRYDRLPAHVEEPSTQLTFGVAERLGRRKQARRELPLAEMEHVVPWNA
ncbi:MAG TPA: hypothetical protein DDZ74_01695 [Pseudomonas sp.]|nr:hypothetical protein [Stenotrophomonas maltophilia]HBK48079.1 hypothetical protein [Pseudomonas sp.]